VPPADLILDRLRAQLGDRYAIERELGQGGMATVYLATDLRHDRSVAIKVLQPGTVLGPERFHREIQLAAGLTHPHIVPLHDSGQVGELLYYVMPFIEGESLQDRLSREGKLPVAEALKIGREVAEALAYAHAHSVIHRDIKPGNVLLAGYAPRERGSASAWHALVVDFGIARAIGGGASSGRITEAGAALGSPMYMSPEQASGDPRLDGRTDIYSLGCVLYEMVTGQPPFRGPTAQAIMVSRLLDTPPPLRAVLPALPASLEAVVQRAMARDREDRFTSADELASALGAVEAGATSGPVPAVTRERVSIAVLPFVNLSPDPENEYFSDGVTDELTNALAKITDLRVTSRTSAFAFKGKERDVKDIGRQLGVAKLLEGSVRKSGNRLRISAQLVNAADGYQVWSETYDRDLTDVFAVQDEISRTIAGALSLRLGRRADAAMVEAGTTNFEAYNLYLKGRYHATTRTTEGLKQAIGYFERAIDADPQYAAAHAELGAAWALRGFEEFSDLPPREAMPKAKQAVQRALQLDPSLGEGHAWMGVIAWVYDWDPASAEREFLRAIALRPQYSYSYAWYAMLLAVLQRAEEAVRTITRARQLDPLFPIVALCAARCYYWLGQLDKAQREVDGLLELNPGYQLAYTWLARILGAQGRTDEALAAMQRAEGLGRESLVVRGFLGWAYGRAGQSERARAILAELEAERKRRWVPAYFRFYILLGLGEFDDAFRALEIAFQERSGYLGFVSGAPNIGDPMEAPIADDPRLREVRHRVARQHQAGSDPRVSALR
jgi:serine/threonine protein kinase/tetratricopeptide (TPR) repeat protein